MGFGVDKYMIKTIQGDILQTDHSLIVQQVNCLGVMGAGLAKQINNQHPHVLPAYREYINKKVLEGMLKSDLLGRVHFVKVGHNQYVANLFGQKDIRKSHKDKTVYTDVDGLKKGFKRIKEVAEKHQLSVAIPSHIGCGLAGGDWTVIRPMIEDLFKESSLNVTFYSFGK